MDVDAIDLRAELERHFGFSSFRPGQEAVVRSVLAGRNTVAVMPTGAGKSLCYQLPALLLPGTALVVSPLVALMKDQVDALTARGVPATFINSSVDEGERRQRTLGVRRGAFKLVYVAPERFKSPAFVQAIQGAEISLYAVDEAHCISQWGHDFRPDYTRLGQVRWTLRPPRTLALTATATPEVQGDIVRVLRLKDPQVSVAGFDRPNLFLEVAKVSGEHDKLTRIAHACKDGGGIVYCATRRDVEKVAGQLDDRGIKALAYHAGMGDDDRRRVQDTFMEREGAVVCATNAFGMGVDKASIRFVAHYAIPKAVEAYYQEVGRAGRDGLPARALLLFNHADVYVQERLVEGNHPAEKLVRDVWRELLDMGGEEARLDEGALARRLGASGIEVGAAVKQLERAGHLQRLPRGVILRDREPELRVDFEVLRQRRRRELSMLRRMADYAYATSCRRAYLLGYFGDRVSTCSGCDVCHGPKDAPTQEELIAPPRKRAARAAKALLGVDQDAPYDGAVFEALRGMRGNLARAEGVPPYVVFHDRTLRALARVLPRNEAAFLSVPGTGPVKWERYGAHVLAAIRDTLGQGEMVASASVVREETRRR